MVNGCSKGFPIWHVLSATPPPPSLNKNALRKGWCGRPMFHSMQGIRGPANHHQIHLWAQRHPGGEKRNGESTRHLLLNLPKHDRLPRSSNALERGNQDLYRSMLGVAGTATRRGSRRRQPETAANHLPSYRQQAMGSAAAPRRVSCGPNAATYVGPRPAYTPTPRHMPVAGD